MVKHHPQRHDHEVAVQILREMRQEFDNTWRVVTHLYKQHRLMAVVGEAARAAGGLTVVSHVPTVVAVLHTHICCKSDSQHSLHLTLNSRTEKNIFTHKTTITAREGQLAPERCGVSRITWQLSIDQLIDHC